jgi:hypothetical protein
VHQEVPQDKGWVMCVCVCVRERERERGWGWERGRLDSVTNDIVWLS